MKGEYCQNNTHECVCGCIYCKNFYFRVVNSQYAGISMAGYAGSAVKEKDDKFYESKDRLFVKNMAFIVPKASPLKARFYYFINAYTS